MNGFGLALFQFYTGHSGTPLLNGVMIVAAEKVVYLIPIALLSLWFTADENGLTLEKRLPSSPSWLPIEHGKRKSVFIFATIVVGLGISYVFGQVYSHPAPYMVGYETLLVDAPENSFPSQHTTVMFAFAWPLFYLQDRWRYGLGALCVASLVGISRVYVGVHYPVDILGAIVASLLGFVVVYGCRTWVRSVADYCIRIEESVVASLQ